MSRPIDDEECGGQMIDGIWDTCGCDCDDCVDYRREGEEG